MKREASPFILKWILDFSLQQGTRETEQTLRFIRVTGLMTHAGYAYKANSQKERIRVSREEGELLVETRTLIHEVGN